MIRWASVLVCSLVGLGAACATGGGPADEPVAAPATTVGDGLPGRASPATSGGRVEEEQLVAAGLDVYRRQYCGVCHQLDTAETQGVFGPSHNGMGTTAARRVADPSYAGTATTAEDYIRESILDPQGYVVPGYEHTRSRMPAYTNLSGQEVDALVQLLLEEN